MKHYILIDKYLPEISSFLAKLPIRDFQKKKTLKNGSRLLFRAKGVACNVKLILKFLLFQEVDGHVIHEKESTYSNGDENGHVVFRSKTVIIRPKDGAGNVDKKFGNGDATSKTQPKRSEYVPRFTTASASVSTFNQNNPDEDVEMVQVSKNKNREDLYT